MIRTVLAAALTALAVRSAACAEARHVVVIVWDGMRPDFITEKYAPTLNALAHDGVRFRNHHSIYCTATDVNGTAIATGVYPNRSGVFANAEFRPQINPHNPVDTAEPDTMRAGDAATGGRYLRVPTLAEFVRKHGGKVAIAGTKSIAALADRTNEWTIGTTREKGLTIFAAAPMSAALREQTEKLLGPMRVDSRSTSQQRIAYATRALTDVLWRDGVPEFSLLWSSEPDLAQHNHAPGSPEALAAIKAADDNLAALLEALGQKHARDSTDVFVVSDHGFSTIRRSIDVVRLLNENGFHAGRDFAADAKRGDILVAGNAGSVLFYVRDHDRPTIERLIDWLESSDFAGVLFSRDPASPGTFPLSAIRIDTADAADVVMAFRWTNEMNTFGTAGMIDADWNRPAGQGTHATLSPSDVHNTLIAAGPDIRRGFEDATATANIDIAPTVLQLLGIQDDAKFDGRVVSEALMDQPETSPPIKRDTLTATRAFADGRQWRQWLEITQVGATTYFDRGNGGPPEPTK